MPDSDYKTLCAELVDIVTAHCNPDDYAVGYCAAVLANARAALAQPEPVELTDKELYELWEESGFESDRFARAVLARWGAPVNTTNQEDYDRG
jgi:hypothetical protein